MIRREIQPRLEELFGQYPIVTVTGPRQSGKTTLCRAAFPQLRYANLEAPDQREFAESDPRGFLAQLGQGAIIDEIQHVPALLSYLQVLVDEQGGNGLYVLTGSEQFKLSDAIGQSLAGRTALLRLLPLTLREWRTGGGDGAADAVIFSGLYPRILDQRLDPRQALGDYFETYVERDVRRLGAVGNLSAFRLFLRLCAGRVGRLLNLSSLGSDAGVSHTTAREWLAVAEASFIAFRLPAFHANIRKRLVRSPKLYFYDVGLAAYLLGIESPRQVTTHPLRGALFENLVVTEALKHGYNRGSRPNLSFYRDSKGLECDLFYETGRGIRAIEAKSGSTVNSDYFRSINQVAELLPDITAKTIVFGGTERQLRSDCHVVPLSEFAGRLERFDVEQDIADFMQARTEPKPGRSGVAKLDAVYARHIRPILEALDPPCQELGEKIGGSFLADDLVRKGSFVADGARLLDADAWEQTKERLLIDQGSKLDDDHPIVLARRYSFAGDEGGSGAESGLPLVIAWGFGAERFSRSVSLDGANLDGLDSTIAYAELADQGPEVDHMVAQVLRSLLVGFGSCDAPS